jgi:23S rRNA (adenine2503-C2)-methyltransferase
MIASLKDLDPPALAAWLAELGQPAYRAAQVLRWALGRGARSFDEMSDLPRDLREALGGAFSLAPLRVARLECSADGTRKFLFELADGLEIESVLIPSERPDGTGEGRLTLCVSSQAGCGMGCGFCATAKLGLRRNLAPGEILEQVLEARRDLAGERPITNLVFMGMGEPLHNYDNVVGAVRALTAEWGLGISPKRITVSTVGLVPQMERLLAETRVNLAVSLSATTDAVRSRLMPVNRKYPLDRLLAACRRLPLPRRKRITFEYVLLAGENDTLDDARRLAGLLHGIRSKVNLIPFNPFPGTSFRTSERARIEAFRQALLDHGLHATIRESRGSDIRAACGQLAAFAAAEHAAA